MNNIQINWEQADKYRAISKKVKIDSENYLPDEHNKEFKIIA